MSEVRVSIMEDWIPVGGTPEEPLFREGLALCVFVSEGGRTFGCSAIIPEDKEENDEYIALLTNVCEHRAKLMLREALA